jgi:hypothetical protein
MKKASLVWLTLVCALLAGVGAAGVGFAPFWLQPGRLSVHLHTQADVCGSKVEDEGYKPLAEWSTLIEPLAEKSARLTIQNSANRSFERPLDSRRFTHGPMVAEQHPPTPPAAAPATARTDRSSSDEKQGDLA